MAVEGRRRVTVVRFQIQVGMNRGEKKITERAAEKIGASSRAAFIREATLERARRVLEEDDEEEIRE